MFWSSSSLTSPIQFRNLSIERIAKHFRVVFPFVAMTTLIPDARISSASQITCNSPIDAAREHSPE